MTRNTIPTGSTFAPSARPSRILSELSQRGTVDRPRRAMMYLLMGYSAERVAQKTQLDVIDCRLLKARL